MKPQILICDKCGATNWNLASEGRPHDQPANEVKGYQACDGIWRFSRKAEILPFRMRTPAAPPKER